MRALALATHGMIPRCPIGANTFGLISCDDGRQKSQFGAGGKRKRNKIVGDEFEMTNINAQDLVVKGETVIATLEGADGVVTEVVYTKPDEVVLGPPLADNWADNALESRDAFDGDYYDELIDLLRFDAIQRHRVQVESQIEEGIRQEEELAVFLMLVGDDNG